MISYPIQGRPTTKRLADVPASDTALYATPTTYDAMLQTMSVCNKTAGAVTFDAFYEAGAATCYLYKGKSVAANDTLLIGGIDCRFEGGSTLKVKANTKTALDISATLIEITKNNPR